MRLQIGLRLLSGLFALFATTELLQLIQAARGEHPDPLGLLLTHALAGLLAVFAAVGLWRRRSWAPVALLGWGAIMAAMLMVLGPVLDEPRETWRGLWVAAAVVALFAAGASWYVRRTTREPLSEVVHSADGLVEPRALSRDSPEP